MKAIEVACPRCKARVGTRCFDDDGDTLPNPHGARVSAMKSSLERRLEKVEARLRDIESHLDLMTGYAPLAGEPNRPAKEGGTE